MRSKRIFWAALVGSALLDWMEWVLHHPPEMALVALIHFVFLWLIIAGIAALVRWLRHRDESRSHG